jgi:transcriptional regulator with XRE-family HTH domain
MQSFLERLDRLHDFFSDDYPAPNKFTIGLGNLVRQARDEAGISQTKLAKLIFRRRATVSNIEAGKSKVTIPTLALIATALEKPITFFLPWFIYENLEPEEFSPLEQEMLLQFKSILADDLKRLAIRQTKEIAETSVKQALEEERKSEKKIAKLGRSED